jgi:hypothetical protein
MAGDEIAIYRTQQADGSYSFSTVKTAGAVRVYNVAGRLVTQEELDARRADERKLQEDRRSVDQKVRSDALENAQASCEAELGDANRARIAQANAAEGRALRSAQSASEVSGLSQEALRSQVRATNVLRNLTDDVTDVVNLYSVSGRLGPAGSVLAETGSSFLQGEPQILREGIINADIEGAADLLGRTGEPLGRFAGGAIGAGDAVADIAGVFQPPDLLRELNNASLDQLRSFRAQLEQGKFTKIEEWFGADGDLKSQVDRAIASKEAEEQAWEDWREKFGDKYEVPQSVTADNATCVGRKQSELIHGK